MSLSALGIISAINECVNLSQSAKSAISSLHSRWSGSQGQSLQNHQEQRWSTNSRGVEGRGGEQPRSRGAAQHHHHNQPAAVGEVERGGCGRGGARRLSVGGRAPRCGRPAEVLLMGGRRRSPRAADQGGEAADGGESRSRPAPAHGDAREANKGRRFRDPIVTVLKI